MKITEILYENKVLEEIKIPEGIKTLKEVPELRGIEYVKKIDANGVKSLVSLEGCPPKVDELWCENTSITSLKGCPKKLDMMWCENTSITSLKGGPERTVNLVCSYNSQLVLSNVWEDLHSCMIYFQLGTIHSDSGLLGLLRVKKLKQIGCDNKSPLSIVAKYVPLRSMSDIIRCKQELINAGFKSNAKF